MKGKNRCSSGVEASALEDAGGSRDFTATLLVILILLTTEITTLVRWAEEQSVRTIVVAVVVGSFHHFVPEHSLIFLHMVTKAAWFSLCIFSFVPYILTSLHVTTSTAIKAVDDNQSAN